MKKKLFLILLALSPVAVIADAIEINGIFYNLIGKGKVAEVTSNPQGYSGVVTIPSTVNYNEEEYNVAIIGEDAFRNCSDLTSVTIPNSVTSIGVCAFLGCKNLSSIEIPNSITKIGGSAFSGCSSLTSIALPESITIIEDGTFSGCSHLVSVNIPNSVTSIGDYAFQNCNGLQAVHISDIALWCNIKFENVLSNPLYYAHHLYIGDDEIKNLAIPENITSIGKCAFAGCSGIATVVIPDNITSIGYEAFFYCDGLKSVVIPNSISTIEEGVFQGCSSLISVEIPNNVTIIGLAAFEKCSSLTSVVIPNSVTRIEDGAFSDCSSLTNVTLGNGINKIWTQAFANCKELTDVFCYAKEVPYTIDNAFYGSYIEYATLHVPYASIEAYQVAEPWKNFKSIVKIDMPKYSLNYLVDNEVYKTYELEEGATITPEPAPTKEGYTFSGWSEIPTTMPAKDVIVTGAFVINKYKLAYMVDGVEYKSYDVEFGATITPEPAPTKEGYTFSGWSDIPATMPAKDVTVTGTFSINKYKLIYMVDGVEYKSYEVEYGASITPEPAPTKEGYTFSGWSDIPATMPAKDVTVTGTFTANAATKYTLTYKVDDEVYKTYELEEGATITPEPAPTKEGYTFSGWSEIPETMPAKDVTVTGSFAINRYKLVYMVDGVEYKSYEVEYGASITPEEAPTKDGYTFSGWSEIPATMPAKDVTVTGSFTANAATKYTLTYKVDNEVYKTYELEEGATITPEPAPTKEGYTFSGWSEIPETMPAKDVTVTGSFAINRYKLVYMVDGVEYKSYEVEYGASITPEATPTKEGYTFSGWSEMPTTMPAKDVTVTGSFAINKYKLVYMVDGTEYKSYDVEFGAAITPETAPTKEGFEFSGWSDIPATMPANDVTITGTFKAIVKADDGTIEVSGGEATVTGGEAATGEVDIPESVSVNGVSYPVTTVSDGAYQNNTNITSVTVPESVTNIGANAFNGCSNLGNVSVGKSVTNIGSKAFANLSAPATARKATTRGASGLVIKCYATNVPTTAADAFENTPIGNATLLVDDNSVAAYKTTAPWSGFGTIKGFSEATGIDGTWINNEGGAKIFSIDGTPLNTPQKGINIIRMDNGETKKVVAK